MGCSSNICVFDHTRYLREVVPAFHAGASHPLVAFHIKLDGPYRWCEPTEFDALADIMQEFDDELLPRSKAVPLANQPARCDYWKLAELYERVVTRNCIGEFVSAGRPCRPYLDTMLRMDATTEQLLKRLAFRAAYWTHAEGGSSEGIQGWLEPDETMLLKLGLDDVEPDPEFGMTDSRQAQLDILRHLLAAASAHAHGILWGGDLMVNVTPLHRIPADYFPRARLLDDLP